MREDHRVVVNILSQRHERDFGSTLHVNQVRAQANSGTSMSDRWEIGLFDDTKAV